jgi:iron complex outermembrane recepter protein
MHMPKSFANGAALRAVSVRLMCSTALLLSCSGIAQAQDTSVGAESDADMGEEIVVTATRRSETLQQIPYSISAVTGGALEKSGVSSINDLGRAVPGLQNVDTGPSTRGGNNNFTMRGLRTDAAGSGNGISVLRQGTVSTVSTYLGETPLFFPLAVKDINRVEILKGPQGTLYGSGAEAGTIRIIPNSPDFHGLSGKFNLQGGLSEHSRQANYAFDGVLNVPLAPNAAIRISGGYERLGGFIDAVGLVQRQDPGNWFSPAVSRVPSDPLSGYVLAPIKRDVNNSTQWFVRGALRWEVSSAIDVELSYVHQRTHVDDIQISNPTYPGGTLNFGVGGPLGDIPEVLNNPNSTNTYRAGGNYRHTNDSLSPSTNELDLANALVTIDVGFATLTSSTSGYIVNTKEDANYTASPFTADANGNLYSAAVFYGGFPRFTYYSSTRSRERALTQEIRLVSNGNGPFKYVLGGYYQDQDQNYQNTSTVPGINDFIPSANPALGDTTYISPFDGNGFRFRDRALFGELTYEITPKWQITGGVRFFWQKFTALGKQYLPFGGAAYSISGSDPDGLAVDVNNPSKVNDRIIKINTSYDFTDNLKVYATYSEGFRRGGANVVAFVGPYASLPQYQEFAPDTAKNYEIGVKGNVFDGKLRFTAALFMIDLENFQFNNTSPAGYPLVFNGTTARSKGFEIEASLRASRNLTLNAAYGYTDAKVRKGFDIIDYDYYGYFSTPPSIITAFSIAKGASLPAVPKHTFNVSGDYKIEVGADASINLHADASYSSSSPGTIDKVSAYYWTIPSYFIANLRATYDTGKAMSFDVFVNNFTNDTAFTGGTGVQVTPSPIQGRYVTRPRTWGAALHYKF